LRWRSEQVLSKTVRRCYGEGVTLMMEWRIDEEMTTGSLPIGSFACGGSLREWQCITRPPTRRL